MKGDTSADEAAIYLNDPERNPFYDGLRAHILDGVEAGKRGEVVDAEDVFSRFGYKRSKVIE